MTTSIGFARRFLLQRCWSAALLLIGYAANFNHVRAQTLQGPSNSPSPNTYDAKTIFANLDSVRDTTKYENGYFITREMPNRVQVLDRQGKSLLDARLLPKEENTRGSIDDAAISKNGVIVVGYFYVGAGDNRRRYHLISYTLKGELISDLDLGTWRAYKVCASGDDDIWTLSSEQVDGSDRYTPGTGVLREYSLGSGLERSLAARELFPANSGNYAAINSILTCSREGVHALTGDGHWIRYEEKGNLEIDTVTSPTDNWELTGYADTPQKLYALVQTGTMGLYTLDKVAGQDSLGWKRVRLSKDCNIISAPEQKKSNLALIGTYSLLGWDPENQAGLIFRQESTSNAMKLPLGCLE
jgi:hypothetical protein